MTTLVQDLRHAFRLMVRAPGFTCAALVTLALAIGVNTAVFSVVYGVLLRPLPYADPDRIVMLSEEHPGGIPIIRDPRLSNLTFEAWRPRARTLEGMSAYSTQEFTIVNSSEIERIDGGSLSPSGFATLGATPAMGRFFRPEEAIAGMTINAARALGLAHEVGTIEAGKAADLCVWRVNELSELGYWIGLPGPERRIFAGQDS